MNDITQHLWWRDLKVEYYLDEDDEKPQIEIPDPTRATHAAPDAHWYFSRNNRKVSHNGMRREIKVALYREFGRFADALIEDPMYWLVVSNGPRYGMKSADSANCTVEECVSPFHSVLVNRNTWMEEAVRARRAKKANDDAPIREKEFEIDGMSFVVGPTADMAYLSKLIAVKDDPSKLLNDAGLLTFGAYDTIHRLVELEVRQIFSRHETVDEVYDRVSMEWSPPRGCTLDDARPAWQWVAEKFSWQPKMAEKLLETKVRAKLPRRPGR